MSPTHVLAAVFFGALAATQVQPFSADPILQAAAQARSDEDRLNEEAAKRLYGLAVGFMNTGMYKQALSYLQTIITDRDNSSVADDALLAAGTYYLEFENDLAKASAMASILVKKPASANAVPGGHILLGRIALAQPRSEVTAIQELFKEAVGDFSAVPTLFPGNSDAVPEALYRLAETYRLWGKVNEAADAYRKVCSDYSRSSWCARSTLGLASCLVRAGQWPRAIERLQWIRTSFPDSPEAMRAYERNTMLYRLYVRRSLNRPPFSLSPRPSPSGPVKDVDAMTIDPAGRLLLALKGGVQVLGQAGARLQGWGSADCRGVFLDHRGRPLAIQPGQLVPELGQPVTLMVMRDAKSKPIEDVSAAVAFSTGEFLVADMSGGTIEIFSSKGEHLKPPFATTVRAKRLAVNDLDDVAILDRDSKAISVVRRSDRSQTTKVPPTGQGFVLQNPVDITFDPLGHLYVLDRDTGTVVVFAPFEGNARPIAVFSIPERTDGAFQKARAFALDAFGRLLIFNDRAERVLIYQ